MKVKIKEHRLKAHLSQNELAKKAGMSSGYLSELEKNKKSPTLRTLKSIADVLNICPKSLIDIDVEYYYKLRIKK